MELEIVTVYKTSKGVFVDNDVAMKNENRAKINDINDPAHGQREPVVQKKAIRYTDGNFYQYLEVAELEVKYY